MPLRFQLFRVPLLLCILSCSAWHSVWSAEPFLFHHENVLGTSLEIQIEADSQAAATAAESAILTEIERLNRIFSGYDGSSEFSIWQQQRDQPATISPELFEVLKSSEHWSAASRGAFNPAVQTLTQLWQRAGNANKPPSPDELAAAVQRVNQLHWKLDDKSRTAQRLSDAPLSLNAIAKGAIVDKACKVAMERAGVRGLIINIGGDLRACGQSTKQIQIADPKRDAVNALPLSTIHISNQAVATSGSYRRGFKVGSQWYSHIINPHTGYPVREVISATVVAPLSVNADALATILNILPVSQGVALIESLPETSCFIVSVDGKQTRSTNWSDLEQPGLFRFASAKSKEPVLAQNDAEAGAANKTADKAPAANESTSASKLLELLVKFELNKPEKGTYRRPYVAIWLEDEDEFPVRTAVLWMQTKQPGPRWHRDLLRWYRNDGVRKLADGTDLIGTISSATRNAGEYKAVFDGKDDAGKPLPPGKYTLLIEVAREHGTYQLIRHKLNLGEQPIAETKLKQNAEIKSASVEYRAPSAEVEKARPAAK